MNHMSYSSDFTDYIFVVEFYNILKKENYKNKKSRIFIRISIKVNLNTCKFFSTFLQLQSISPIVI